jgi:peptidoglycan/xylan/chitin deacetylase (PgdA/CDA1 family)
LKLVSPLLKRVLYPSLSQTGCLRRRSAHGPAIVTYHGVLPEGYRVIDGNLDGSLVTTTALRQQIRLLKQNYEVISPADFRGWCEGKLTLSPHAVLITCDDGLQNVVTDMLPVLQECSARCLFFITATSLEDTRSMLWYEELYLMFLSSPASFAFQMPDIQLEVNVGPTRSKHGEWWQLVKQLSRIGRERRQEILLRIQLQLGLANTWKSQYAGATAGARRFYLLSASEVRELSAAGMTLGAHTISHPILSETSEELARHEISHSRTQLASVTGQEVWAFAYPFGDPASVGARDLHLAEQAGFSCAFMNAGGGFGTELPRFALPRVHMTREMSLAEFEAHVSGFYRSLRQRFAGRGGGFAISAQGAAS